MTKTFKPISEYSGTNPFSMKLEHNGCSEHGTHAIILPNCTDVQDTIAKLREIVSSESPKCNLKLTDNNFSVREYND